MTPTFQPTTITAITTSYNHARLVNSTALLFSLPFTLMKAYCQLAKTSMPFSKKFYNS